MTRFRFVRGGDASTSVRVVTIAVIVLGAIVTGSVSLILEDVLPKSNPEEVFVVSRWVFLGSSLLLVALAVWLRYEVRSYSGTLFSVQVLDEGTADRLNEGGMDFRLAAENRYMYLRCIHRWADYEHSTEHGVLDLHELAQEIGVTLETLLNTAPDEGRKTIAPNMPWPMAMAVGAYLPARQTDIHVLELPHRKSDREHEFPLRPADSDDPGENVRTTHRIPDPAGNRIGIVINLDPESEPPEHNFARYLGITVLYRLDLSSGTDRNIDSVRYEEPELESYGRRIAEELIAVKEEHPDDELVVDARIPPAIALSAGWHLTQHSRPLYRDTHLLYRAGEDVVSMRVRPSQPRHGLS